MDEHPLIIIGAGLAGWTTAREFRKLNPSDPVLLVCADAGDLYAKPSLSNALAQKRTPEQLVSTPAATMAQSLNVTLLANTTVLAVNPEAQTITTAQGDFSYRQLVLATGAKAIRVPLEGNAADQVVSVNSLADFTRFHAQLTIPNGGSRHVAIMGAGLIGCEFANDLVVAGYQVSVVDPSSRPLATLLPIDASMQLQEALASVGVAWHWDATVRAVDLATVTTDTEATPAFTLQLSTGQTLSADLVLSAIGLKADLTLAQPAGLVCDRGFVVNRSLQTSARRLCPGRQRPIRQRWQAHPAFCDADHVCGQGLSGHIGGKVHGAGVSADASGR